MLGEFQNDQQFVEKIKPANNLYAENQTRNDSIYINITSKLSKAQFLLVTSKQRVYAPYLGEFQNLEFNFDQN